MQWTPDGNGNSSARTMLAAASFGDTRRPLAAHIVNVTTTATAASLQGDEGKVVPIQVTIRVPRRTRSVRVVAMIEPGGKIGTAEVSRRDLNAAPAAPTPQPRLNLRPSRSSSANQ